MKPNILIFDLSEVLIAGLYGVQHELAETLSRPEAEILDAFHGECFEQLLTGRIDEESYLAQVLARAGWPLRVPDLQAAIRRNLDREVEGMAALLADLAPRAELVLLSDHAREWIAYIRGVHPILGLFRRTFFSFDVGTLKHEPATFAAVLRALDCPPADCLFVDDNPANLRAAAAAGIDGILFRDAAHLAAELRARQLLDPAIAIRCYRPADLAACRGLWAELVGWHRHLYGDPSIGGEEPGLHFDGHLARLGPERIWVAEIDGQVVALAGLEPLGDDGRQADVEPVVVTAAQRRTGVGSALLAHVVREARRLGVRYLNLRPVARNLAAIGFFYDAGFQTLGQIELFMDLAEPGAVTWLPGPEVAGRRFRH
jgi:HAD superfamily hydrolase (TIGR01509 family)